MNAIQLEFPIKDETDVEIKINYVQKENALLRESLRKIQKRLFAEVSDLRKLCIMEMQEKEELKSLVRKMINEKAEWLYGEANCLFYERKDKTAKC